MVGPMFTYMGVAIVLGIGVHQFFADGTPHLGKARFDKAFFRKLGLAVVGLAFFVIAQFLERPRP